MLGIGCLGLSRKTSRATVTDEAPGITARVFIDWPSGGLLPGKTPLGLFHGSVFTEPCQDYL